MSPLISTEEIRSRAAVFAKDWYNEKRERAEKDTFWNDFFNVFGVNRRRVAVFEAAYRRERGGTSFVDVFWPGKLLCEQKSAGKNLDDAVEQAYGYLKDIEKHEPENLPRYIIVCNFAHMRLIDVEGEYETLSFDLIDLPEHIGAFGFISGYEQQIRRHEENASIAAAEQMGRLYDAIRESGYDEHALKFLLIRLLFCLFAEDTGIFNDNQFEQFIRTRTSPDGSDLAEKLNTLFYNLNLPTEKRLKTLDETIAAFPYINGALFAEYHPPAAFNRAMRDTLLEACALDWSHISPEIFGAMFQSVMDTEARRALGAHYTEETNILKVINGLLMNGLRDELANIRRIKNDKNRTEALLAFHDKIAGLRFLDPACGCGNFLVVAYRELRLLELDVVTAIHGDRQMQLLDISATLRCDVGQFYGIEIEEFPALIARLALWLTDHQQNRIASETFGKHFARIPLSEGAHIALGSALQNEWPSVDYILGNPPFIGKNYQSALQKAEQKAVMSPHIRTFGNLDYVANWYVKAAGYLKNGFADGTRPKAAAFVSTNSITQGEQVPLLWGCLKEMGMHIRFAHRTFAWTSAARGKAAVHCVIIGFSPDNLPQKALYDTDAANPHLVPNINGYLLAAPDVYMAKRKRQISGELEMVYGSKPTDGGNLLLSPEEKDALLQAEPDAARFIRPFVGAEEFLNGKTRYCLWFADEPPMALAAALAKLPETNRRIAAVRAAREKSAYAKSIGIEQTPHLFECDRHPREGNYLIIPEVSSERRAHMPIDYLSYETVTSNLAYMLPHATLYHFGILMSSMHNAFMRAVAGRLESRYRYGSTLVYNNFPYPFTAAERETDAAARRHVSAIEAAAQGVLDARKACRDTACALGFPAPTLAQLYNPPPAAVDPYAPLRAAHAKLDAAVDAAYRKAPFKDEAERVAYLFAQYQQLTGA